MLKTNSSILIILWLWMAVVGCSSDNEPNPELPTDPREIALLRLDTMREIWAKAEPSQYEYVVRSIFSFCSACYEPEHGPFYLRIKNDKVDTAYFYRGSAGRFHPQTAQWVQNQLGDLSLDTAAFDSVLLVFQQSIDLYVDRYRVEQVFNGVEDYLKSEVDTFSVNYNSFYGFPAFSVFGSGATDDWRGYYFDVFQSLEGVENIENTFSGE